MMSMHSVTVLMIGLVVAIVVIGGLLVVLRVYGARQSRATIRVAGSAGGLDTPARPSPALDQRD